MTEDKSKNDEPKLEFDSAGQAIAYISLDQARVLALRHARDNREFYGRRYSWRELTWEELSAEESEDYYRVRLSYRPAQGFSGEPGVEQFTIDKSGPIELRQIISRPRSSRRLQYGLVVVGVIVAVGATLAGLFFSGMFSSSLNVVSISISPDAPARLVSSRETVTVDDWLPPRRCFRQ